MLMHFSLWATCHTLDVIGQIHSVHMSTGKSAVLKWVLAKYSQRFRWKGMIRSWQVPFSPLSSQATQTFPPSSLCSIVCVCVLLNIFNTCSKKMDHTSTTDSSQIMSRPAVFMLPADVASVDSLMKTSALTQQHTSWLHYPRHPSSCFKLPMKWNIPSGFPW